MPAAGRVARARMLLATGLGTRLVSATLGGSVIWGLGTIITFSVGTVLARNLGPAGYGTYGTAMAIVSLLGVPAQFGLPLLATREIAKAIARGQPGHATAIIRWFSAMVLGFSLLLGAGVLACTAALPLPPALRAALMAAAWLVPALSLGAVAIALLRGYSAIVTSKMIDVLVRPLLFLAALGATLVLTNGRIAVTQALIAQVVASLAVALIAYLFVGRRVAAGAERAGHRLRGWMASAVPMAVSEAMRTIDGSYGVLVVGAMTSVHNAGLFRIAVASLAFVNMPISIQNILVAPYLAAAYAEGSVARLQRILTGSVLFMTSSVGAGTLAFALFGRLALAFAFGAAFADAYWPLLILCLAQLAASLLGPGVTLLSMTGEERAVSRWFAISVAVAVAAALLLTPPFGVVGTALAAMIGTVVRGIALNRIAARRLGVRASIAALILPAPKVRDGAAMT